MTVISTPHRLRILRAERGRLYSQEAVAKAARISYNRYWRIENGVVDATPEEQKALAGVFGVRVADAFPLRDAGAA